MPNENTNTYQPKSITIGDVIDNFDGKRFNTSQAGNTWFYSLVEYQTQRGKSIRLVATKEPANIDQKIAFINDGGIIYGNLV
jgi:hypothetical protein